MFEVIISAVNTGRVQRKVFETPEQADKYIDRFMSQLVCHRPRNPRNYRVEVHTRLAPPVAAQPAPATVPLSAHAVSPGAAA